MNPASRKEAKRLFDSIKTKAKKLSLDTVIMPPSIYIPLFSPAGNLKLGAQDSSAKEGGAFTGEISAKMLKDAGITYVLIGHSERRELGEGDDIINEKLRQVYSAGLRAILCIGEKEKSHEAFPSIVKEQIKKAYEGTGRKYASRTIIAYEPVWAISSRSGATADRPQNFFEMSIYIRRTMLDIWGKAAALKIPIIYGGSVNSKNVKGFLDVENCAGLLVGRASLAAEEFKKILEIANKK